jgi:hypothetical protein
MIPRFFVDYFGDFGCCCCRRYKEMECQTDVEPIVRKPVYIQKGGCNKKHYKVGDLDKQSVKRTKTPTLDACI